MFFVVYFIGIIVFCIGCDNSPTSINASADINVSKSGVTISINDGTVPASTGPKENRVIPPVPDLNTTRPTPVQMKPIAPVIIPPKDDFKILLPIEIMSDNIAVLPERKVVFTLTKAQATAIKTMDITFHGLSYQSKASVKFNSGVEQDINEKNTRIKLKGSVKSLGGINGGYAVVPMDIQVNPGELVEGSNTVTFRMINRRASATGFRVLYFNFTLDDNTDLFPQTAYEESSFANDPVQWPPASTDSNIISNGKNLWLGLGGASRRPLKSLEGKVMKASCSDCHLKSGWDLKYFNYSSMSISARSMAHGLTKDEGSAIASYINSLNVQPYGRPWNPVYQPGPGLESKPIEQWAAGAGAAWVLGKDSYTSLFLYPKNKADKVSWQPEQLNGGIKTPDSKNLSIKSYNFTLKDLAARTEVQNPVSPEQFGKNGYLNTIETPVSIQLPDWNEWLPRIWPGDLDDNFIPGDNPAVRPLFRRNSGDPSKSIGDLFLDSKTGANSAFNNVYSTLAGMSLPDRMQYLKDKMSPQVHDGIIWPELSTVIGSGGINQYMAAHGSVVDPDTVIPGKDPQYFGQSVLGSGNCDALFKDKNTSQQVAIYKSSSPNRQFNISRFCDLGANDPLYPNNRKIAYKDFDDYETAMDSVNKWGMVKAFELHHVFSLLNLGQYLDPEQQKLPPNGNFNSRKWVFGRPFLLSPHMSKLSWENIGADYIRKEAYTVRSDQWYYAQIILNPSDNRRARGKESPLDWGYMYGFMDTAGKDFASDIPREIAPSMMRYLLSSQKKMQSSYPTAPRGEFYEGWSMEKMFDGWYQGEDNRNFYFFGDLTKFIPKNVGRPEASFAEALNDASSPEAKVFLNNITMHNYQSWFDETKNHKPKEFFTGYVDSDGKEHYIGRGAGICNNKEPDAEFSFAECDAINSDMSPQQIGNLSRPPVIEPSQVLIYQKKYTNPYFYRKNAAEQVAGTVALARAQGVNSPLLDQMICYVSYAAPNPTNVPILQSLMSDKRVPKWDITNKKCQ